MNRPVLLICLLCCVATQSLVVAADAVDYRCNFDDPEAASQFVATVTGEAKKRKGGAKLQRGQLYLLASWWKSDASVGFAAPSSAYFETIELEWTLSMNTGTEGAGFVWLDTAEYGSDGAAPTVEQWEAPSVARAFGIGFDASNPPNRDPFRGSGNAYDRPQHELSLHWNGTEIHKMTTPKEFRDEKPHAVKARIRFVTGGALVDVSIDGDALYDGYFIPEMTAFVGRPGFGARNSETAGDVFVDDFRARLSGFSAAPPAPLSIVAINRKINDKDHPKNESVVEFPEDNSDYARIIMTLRLDKPDTRFDPWDRAAYINVFDGDEKYELVRYITPYHKGGVWKADVTAFRSLLQGQRRIEQTCGTQGEGWIVTVAFDFYPGKSKRLAYDVVRLWSGRPEIGNPDKPVSDFYVPRVVELGADTVAAEVRSVVTGHGMHPNTNNAAEFMPIERTLTINGTTFTNNLWKTDNYLNPCRPQGGTWKYDRAGWAPGDLVRPWVVDASALVGDDRRLHVGYTLAPYVNEGRGKTWAPFHRTEAYVVLYRKAGAAPSSSVGAHVRGQSASTAAASKVDANAETDDAKTPNVAAAVQQACKLLLQNQESYKPDPAIGRLPDAKLEGWQERERERLSKIRTASEGAAEWPYEGVYRVRPDGRIPVGYRVGGTAIVAEALLEAPGLDAARRRALLRATAFMLDAIAEDPGMAAQPQRNYDVRYWGHTYALSFFVRALESGLLRDSTLFGRVDTAIPHVIECLKLGQVRGGGWNYAARTFSPFMTGSTLIALFRAEAAGYDVDAAMVEKALDRLETGRGEGAAYAYAGRLRNPDEPMAGASARSAIAELVLLRAGRSSVERLRTAIDGFFDENNWKELLKRKSQQGTHEKPYGVAPYYFFYGHAYAAIAVEHLPEVERPRYRERMRDLLWRTIEPHGGWNDRVFPRTESYSTAMAILSLIAEELPMVPTWETKVQRERF
ncbi:MAG: peptide-N-glycosidase F-related protein [Planctomycetota bacterium]